jgi:hypothetical protein
MEGFLPGKFLVVLGFVQMSDINSWVFLSMNP